MPIRRLVEHNDAFSPEDVQVLLGTYDDTLRALNLTDRERPLTMMVAKLIIESAKEGERDPARLRDLVLKTSALNKRQHAALSRKSPGASDGLYECSRQFCREDRGDKYLIEKKCNNSAKGREQRNHDERANS